MNDMHNDRLRILLEEYSVCNEGYNNRDSMIFSEFSVLLAVFSGLSAILVYISDKLIQPLLSISIFILGILGFLSIMSISIDIQSTHSSKVAIRKRMKDIEAELNGDKVIIQLWTKKIENRERYLLERFFKPNNKNNQKNRETYEKEIDFLNLSLYFIIFLWIFMVVVFVGSYSRLLSCIFLGIIATIFFVPKLLFKYSGDKNAKK